MASVRVLASPDQNSLQSVTHIRCRSDLSGRKRFVLLSLIGLVSCSTGSVPLDSFPQDVSTGRVLASSVCAKAGFDSFEDLSDDIDSASFNCQKGELFVAVSVFFSIEAQRTAVANCESYRNIFKEGRHYVVVSLPSSARVARSEDLDLFVGQKGTAESAPKFDPLSDARQSVC